MYNTILRALMVTISVTFLVNISHAESVLMVNYEAERPVLPTKIGSVSAEELEARLGEELNAEVEYLGNRLDLLSTIKMKWTHDSEKVEHEVRGLTFNINSEGKYYCSAIVRTFINVKQPLAFLEFTECKKDLKPVIILDKADRILIAVATRPLDASEQKAQNSLKQVFQKRFSVQDSRYNNKSYLDPSHRQQPKLKSIFAN